MCAKMPFAYFEADVYYCDRFKKYERRPHGPTMTADIISSLFSRDDLKRTNRRVPYVKVFGVCVC